MRIDAKYVLPAVFGLASFACGDDAAVDQAEEEVITTLNLTFTPPNGPPITASFRDPDGAGGDDPSRDDVVLVNGTSYDLEIEVLNETVDPADPDFRIIEEIREEAEEHQFFFTGPGVESVTTGDNPDALVAVTYADVESDYVDEATDPDLPVGIQADAVAESAGSEPGGFVVTLMHQPPNGGVPVKTESSGLDDGEVDIEVAFDLTVQ